MADDTPHPILPQHVQYPDLGSTPTDLPVLNDPISSVALLVWPARPSFLTFYLIFCYRSGNRAAA